MAPTSSSPTTPCSVADPYSSGDETARLDSEILRLRRTLRRREVELEELRRRLGEAELRGGRSAAEASLEPGADEEKNRLEAQIFNAQKLESLGTLAGGIAHDFNNLLLGILGNTGLAIMKSPPDAPSVPFLREVEKTAHRAADLVSQMLAYSGQGKLLVETVDLSQLITEMRPLLEVSTSKQARLELELSGRPTPVEGDATQIRQVVMNLVTNASDALGQTGGSLTVRTGVLDATSEELARACLGDDREPGCYVLLEVSDGGCGMDSVTRDRIFDPFFTTKADGRGLGMAAVIGIVRGHGGCIRVESEPGHGTTCRVLLPFSVVRRRRLRGAEDAWIVSGWRGQGTVLVVDDEEVIRLVAERTLSDAGFDVLMAEDGARGLELFRRRRGEIDAVLLDISMPRLNGVETLYELRSLRRDLRVILSSGYAEQEVLPAFSGRQRPLYLKKPYQPADLLMAMHRLMERPAARDRHGPPPPDRLWQAPFRDIPSAN